MKMLVVCALAMAAAHPAHTEAKPPKSKIGIHLLHRYTDGARKIIQADCPVIKILDCHADMMNALKDYRTAHPDGIVVLRIYTPTRYEASADPAASAKDYWERWLWPQLSRLTEQQRKWITYLEGPNEGDNCPTWGSVADTRWFAEFWVTLAPIMTKHGYRPCVASIPVGNPPGSPDEVDAKIRAFVPALRAARKAKGAWSYHPYTLKYTKDPAVEIYYSLRYRRFHDILARHAPDVKNLPMVLTEGGVDTDGTHGSKPGWKRDTEARFKDWLAWFDLELSKDPYVKGCTLFQIGHPENWDSFDLEPIADWLAGYLGNQSAERRTSGKKRSASDR